jgi:hypothetical protein
MNERNVRYWPLADIPIGPLWCPLRSHVRQKAFITLAPPQPITQTVG